MPAGPHLRPSVFTHLVSPWKLTCSIDPRLVLVLPIFKARALNFWYIWPALSKLLWHFVLSCPFRGFGRLRFGWGLEGQDNRMVQLTIRRLFCVGSRAKILQDRSV